ncbi:hypothetical protein TSMEX_010560 [Taenia solium]|eukprot:TsM_001121700 transcript=TsM_001121700 gene=TsM_001121700
MSDDCSNYRTPSDSDNESIITLSASTEGPTDCETDSSVWSELGMTIGSHLSDTEDDLEEWKQGKESFTNPHARQSGSGGPDNKNEATSNEHGCWEDEIYPSLDSYNFESDAYSETSCSQLGRIDPEVEGDRPSSSVPHHSFRCTICGMRFACYLDLSNHFVLRHPGEILSYHRPTMTI